MFSVRTLLPGWRRWARRLRPPGAAMLAAVGLVLLLEAAAASAAASIPSCRSTVSLSSASARCLLRRDAVLGLSSWCAVASPAAASLDGVPDVGDMYAARKKLAPVIVKGFKQLEAAGAVEEDWLVDTLPKMGKAMGLWGAMQRRSQTPDKFSRTLQKDAAAFEKVAKTKDFQATMQSFQAYVDDLPAVGPGGPGKLNFDDPLGVPPPSSGLSRLELELMNKPANR
eukprot:TRINITY_DN103606_c0_g1_i1.p1 TRINITY_DN103606_c0_g1~~TRINITY_DN103606_c0_g1_i1.p1  ORF type:complete len:226 (+),score=43.17 TRINITY_DN103606_c0_g1_i1:91-768(+)